MQKDTKKLLGVTEVFLILIVVMMYMSKLVNLYTLYAIYCTSGISQVLIKCVLKNAGMSNFINILELSLGNKPW